MKPASQAGTNASHDDDVKVLHSMGYAQQLSRRMGVFSNFAISFSIICILSGVGDAAEGPLVVLGLEGEVALTHDDDRGEEEKRQGLDALYVPLDQRELLAGLCKQHTRYFGWGVELEMVK